MAMSMSADCAAVQHIFHTTSGEQWVNSQGWSLDTTSWDCCAAFGVGCNGDGKVLSITLDGNGLTGSLPQEDAVWAHLDMLQMLTLADNALTGPIPPALANLPANAHIDLSYNQFFGYIPKLNSASMGTCHLDGNPMNADATMGLCETDTTAIMCSFSGATEMCSTHAAALDAASMDDAASADLADTDAMTDPAGLDDGTSDVDGISDSVNDVDPNADLNALSPDQAAALSAHVNMAQDGTYNEFGKSDTAVFTNGQSMNAAEASHSLSAGAIALIVGACVVVGAAVPTAVVIHKRRAAAAGSNLKADSDINKGSAAPQWFKRFGSDGKDSKDASAFATSNVRRFNVDGAYPGMPGYRNEEDSDVPAFQQNATSRRASAMSTSSELSNEDAVAPSARRMQLHDPIVERASEDSGRDLEEAGAARSSASPYGSSKKPAATTTTFFSRLLGGVGARSAVPTSEDVEANAPTAAMESEESMEHEDLSGNATAMYSHQTRHEVEEIQVRRQNGSPDGKYTGFTAPGSSAAKRAANRAKKAKKVPNVIPKRGGSLAPVESGNVSE